MLMYALIVNLVQTAIREENDKIITVKTFSECAFKGSVLSTKSLSI